VVGALALGSRKSEAKPAAGNENLLDLLDITVDDLDEQMCWDCWPEGDDVYAIAADTPFE
jgi:hypothetical protein